MRVHLLRSGSFWQPAFRFSANSLQESSRWSHLPPSQDCANLVFKTNIAVQALLHDLLVCRFTVWPYRLVDLLSEDVVIQEEAYAALFTARPCMLDEYSLSLRETYPTSALLSGDSARLELRVILESLCCTTFDIERMHSANLRRMKARRQTHNMSLEDIALTHIGIGASKPCASLLLHQQRGNPPTSQSANADVQDDSKRRRGGGGGFRAFCHLESQGQVGHGKANFQALARAYNELPQEEKSQYLEVGHKATLAHRSGEQAFHPTHAAVAKSDKKHAGFVSTGAGSQPPRCLQDLHLPGQHTPNPPHRHCASEQEHPMNP